MACRIYPNMFALFAPRSLLSLLPQSHFSNQGLLSSTPLPHPRRSTAPAQVRPLHVHYTTCSILETLVHSSPRPTMRLLIATVLVLSATRSALGSAYVGCFPSSDVTDFSRPTLGDAQASNAACIVSDADSTSKNGAHFVLSDCVSSGLPRLLLLHRIDVRPRSAIDRTGTVGSLNEVCSSSCYCSASTVFPEPGNMQQGSNGNPGGCSPGLAIVSVVQCPDSNRTPRELADA